MTLDTSLLNTQQYKVRINGKVEQSWERSSALPTPRCRSYWKGNHLVALEFSRQLYFTILIFMLLTILIFIVYVLNFKMSISDILDFMVIFVWCFKMSCC